MGFIERLTVVAYSLSLFVVSGCAGIGPHTVARDRFDYTEALSDSWKQQMLYNIVKIRYGDTPVFIEVASILNSYSLATSVNVSASWQAPLSRNANAVGVGGSGMYTDSPTITYSPLTGEKFARSLMKPIPPSAILALVEAGYPVDIVFRLCVSSINGIRNRYGGSARARPADPEFYPLLERMRKIQSAGAVALRVQKTDEMEGMVMIFRGKVDSALEEDTLFVRRTLGLDLTAGEFNVVYGSIAKGDRELAILSRSILEIIIDLSSNIEVPTAHVEEKRVNPTMTEETATGATIPPLIRIQSSRAKPEDAFIVVPYRDHWFWIDDRDLRSKSLFTFMSFLFALTETGGKENAPVITIPAR
jgi:hypothetical protein